MRISRQGNCEAFAAVTGQWQRKREPLRITEFKRDTVQGEQQAVSCGQQEQERHSGSGEAVKVGEEH